MLRYQRNCMLRRVQQYKAVLDGFGLELPPISARPTLELKCGTEQTVERAPQAQKKRAQSVSDWQYCDICAERPRRKKEVLIVAADM